MECIWEANSVCFPRASKMCRVYKVVGYTYYIISLIIVLHYYTYYTIIVITHPQVTYMRLAKPAH